MVRKVTSSKGKEDSVDPPVSADASEENRGEPKYSNPEPYGETRRDEEVSERGGGGTTLTDELHHPVTELKLKDISEWVFESHIVN